MKKFSNLCSTLKNWQQYDNNSGDNNCYSWRTYWISSCLIDRSHDSNIFNMRRWERCFFENLRDFNSAGSNSGNCYNVYKTFFQEFWNIQKTYCCIYSNCTYRIPGLRFHKRIPVQPFDSCCFTDCWRDHSDSD